MCICVCVRARTHVFFTKWPSVYAPPHTSLTCYTTSIVRVCGGSHPSAAAIPPLLPPQDECQIADGESQFIKRSDCDTIFIVCNFQPDKKSAEAQVNLENAMMRYEFLESLVRAALAKYGKGQATEDVAEAVRTLLEKNVAPNLPGCARHVPNDFRINRLYFEEVDLVLKRHQVGHLWVYRPRI